ncbi:MAG: dTDP-4-keto-6-deoxy-D-glucose epimerase [Pelagibacteraceae bacterium TMED124]|nr:dTDP-4-dehydrorhamnose 3,5-epimerase [Candidatus Neomarinimicrobiota bacterium]RPG17214.1 MAG: dTDP-4-keto-6-deoxy-D-glucose epimerase [Pelagibacteraceae bacterium TMED124]|tara:strand:- start:191 stop:730 length:540 start_codon:yes stop_codon:yes gene_type:complete
MKFKSLNISGVYKIIPKKLKDTRGFFLRNICEKILKKNKINFNVKQCNLSFNKKKFTFRGFHYSTNKHQENKILCVVNGKIENHIIDLRKNSKTFLKKTKVILDSKNNNLIYIPSGCANGFLTLENDTLVHYYMDNFFSENSKVYKGFRFDDPLFTIKFRKQPLIISKKDKEYKNITLY